MKLENRDFKKKKIKQIVYSRHTLDIKETLNTYKQC